MARFSSFKKIVYLSCSIATLSLFSDGVFGAEEKEEDLRSNTQSPVNFDHFEASNLDSSVLEPFSAGITEQPERIEIPISAKGNEALYDLFMRGSLIYRPNEGSTDGQIVMPIHDIANPNTLEGTFDLSRCGGAGKYLSISTGFRRGNIVSNANKIEVWIVPKFMAEQNINGSARYLKPVMNGWSASYGIFFTWGNWDSLDWYNYDTKKSLKITNSDYLSKIIMRSRFTCHNRKVLTRGSRYHKKKLSTILIKFD